MFSFRRVLVGVPVVWTGGWVGYYAYTDTLRRWHIRSRQVELERALSTLPGGVPDYTKPATELEKAALKKRYSSLNYAGRYWNPYVEWREQGAWEWALWKMVVSTVTLKLFYDGGVPPERPIADLPITRPNFSLLFGPSAGDKQAPVRVTDKMTMTWLGQSSTYVTMDNLAILTDPALSDRTLDSWVAPRRLRPPPCELKELQKIDLVLVSHNHFDHLDPEAIKELGDSCEWVVPVGVGPFIRSFGVSRVKELDWWEETEYTLKQEGREDKQFTIMALPVMHWSARSPLDTNSTLWSGFHVKSNPKDGSRPRSFVHLGDTGYSGTLFAAVGRVLGPVDLAAIPIGAYEPRWHLHLHHTDPEGAVRMAMQLDAKKSVGVHWGTWLMSDEAYNRPPVDLAHAKAKLDYADEKFITAPVGETILVE